MSVLYIDKAVLLKYNYSIIKRFATKRLAKEKRGKDMKITKIGDIKIIMQNPDSKHNYFAWPSAVRLQNGKIAVVASGYRERHVCPFGKTVISYSEDEGETYTFPAPVIDTPLDDRDGGIMTFGEKGVIVTSFNNTVEFQRDYANAYDNAYLDSVTAEEEQKYHGSTFRVSKDCGVTFGKIYKSPVTNPHGPVELPDGTILWVGNIHHEEDKKTDGHHLQAYKINVENGTSEYLGKIKNMPVGEFNPYFCEPHTIVADDGTIITHIRVEQGRPVYIGTIFQTISKDGGKTWSTPVQLLADVGGLPPHILKLANGTLVCTYGFREEPYGIRAMVSKDNGKTWQTDMEVCRAGVDWDLGYPASVELKDGSILTVFYAHESADKPAVIMQQKWKLEE